MTTIDLDRRDFTVISSLDPVVQELADALPIMKNGKPRKFRRFCECFEWTFTQVQHKARRLNNHFVDAGHLVETVERRANALWWHQNPAIAKRALGHI